jgi:hypothetical protein
MIMTTNKIFILLISLFIFSCSQKEEIVPKESPELIEMRKQKAIWEARKIKSYTVDHIKLCYCPGTGRYKFVVKDQILQSAFNIDTNEYVETTSLKEFKTIDQIYAFMETTLKAKPFFSYIEYDKEGVPTRVSFDINELIQDEEIEYFYGGLIGNR